MKDKEEDISWLFLWGATILYIVLVCMAFAGLVVIRPTVGVAFLDFTKDYGALLAGIPVLIAVLVAKQQLDANRRQHVATIKRELREELETLEKLQKWAQIISTSTMETASQGLFFDLKKRLKVFTYSTEEIERWENKLPSELYQLSRVFHDDIRNFNTRIAKTKVQIRFATSDLEELRTLAKEIQNSVKSHYSHLSQYWS